MCNTTLNSNIQLLRIKYTFYENVSCFFTENLQAPRFTTSSPTSGIVRLGNTKIIQCQAIGELFSLYNYFFACKSALLIKIRVTEQMINTNRQDLL